MPAKMMHRLPGRRTPAKQVDTTCAVHPGGPHWRRLENVPLATAQRLAAGNPVIWFPRQDGIPAARTSGGAPILAVPPARALPSGSTGRSNSASAWRPFCPSMLSRVAPQMSEHNHPAPFAMFTIRGQRGPKTRVPEVVHCWIWPPARPALAPGLNDRYYALMEEMERLTGGVVLNTSLNRRGKRWCVTA